MLDGFSRSTVSELCKRLDPIVEGWNHRNLRENRYSFVLADALVLSIREDHRILHHTAMVAKGINEEGDREILGLMLCDSESEASWREFFSRLKSRDLRAWMWLSRTATAAVRALQTESQGCTGCWKKGSMM
ncbi:hypothetical protein Alches_28620 [Alicyclobacillus hesperidum subsp. aegles]|nr:hypothetical protein Alches_28620 [Alicyclobacillus hesperidum subsp. aegles]